MDKFDATDQDDYETFCTLNKMMKSKNFLAPDEETVTNFHKVNAHLLKNHLFTLSMFCKERGWHQTGLCLLIASEQIECMLDQGLITQSIEYLDKITNEVK